MLIRSMGIEDTRCRDAAAAAAGGRGVCEDTRVRLRLDLAYDGTDFHGWARQPGLRTVQGTLEAALVQVLRVDAVHRQPLQVELLQDAQRDQRRDALAVGRDLVQGVAPVVLGDGRDPFGLVGREVAGLETASMGR